MIDCSSSDKNLTIDHKVYAASRALFGTMVMASRWLRRAEGLGESRAGKLANSPVGAISGGVGPHKAHAVFYAQPFAGGAEPVSPTVSVSARI